MALSSTKVGRKLEEYQFPAFLLIRMPALMFFTLSAGGFWEKWSASHLAVLIILGLTISAIFHVVCLCRDEVISLAAIFRRAG